MAAFDIFRRAAGIQTASAKAQEERAALSASSDPIDRFSVAIADKVSTYGLDQAARAIPELTVEGGKWSRDQDQRWTDIAKAARGIAERIQTSPLQGLDRPLTEAVNRQYLEDIAAGYGGRGPVSKVAGDARRELGTRVRSVVSGGKVAEDTAFEHVVSMEGKRNLAVEARLSKSTAEHVAQPENSDRQRHREWLLNSTRAYLAMARTGLVSPDEVVGYARETQSARPTGHGPAPAIDWSARDRASTPEARREIVSAEVSRAVSSARGNGATVAFPKVEQHAPEADWLKERRRAWVDNDRRDAVSVPGETVGERAGQEIREAIAGRVKTGERWRAPAGTLIRTDALEGSMEDLEHARTGQIEKIANEAFRQDMVQIARHAKEVYTAPQRDEGFRTKSADALIRDMAAHASDLTKTEEVRPRDLDMGPLPLSADGRRDMLRIRQEWSADVKAGRTPETRGMNHDDELAHRYMAAMLKDAYREHPLVVRKFDNHADEIRTAPGAARAADRGSNPIEDKQRTLTIVGEAQRHLDAHYGRRNGYRDGAELGAAYARELKVPEADPAFKHNDPGIAVRAARMAMQGRQMG